MISQKLLAKLRKTDEPASGGESNFVAPVERSGRLAYTKRETCALLGIGETTLWRLEKRGLIRPVPYLRTKIFARSEIERFLSKLEVCS